jgi:predicted amidohydrolase YtcJ
MTAGLEETSVRVFRARRFVTLDGPEVEALAVAGGRVAGRGSTDGARRRYPHAEVVDLDGVVVPGFHDAHTHLAMTSEDLLHLDLSPGAVGSHRDLLAAVRREAERTVPGGWVRGSRYDDAKTSGGERLTRFQLDEVTGDVPALVVHVACHWGIANSAALAAAGIDEQTPPPTGGDFGRDGAGRLNGMLLEQALFAFANPAMTSTSTSIAPESSMADRLTGLRHAVEAWHRVGLTSVCDAMVGPDDLALFSEASHRGLLTLRTGMLVTAPHVHLVHRLGLRSGLGDEMLRFVGIKAFVDGAVGGRTCLVDEAHVDGSHGIQSTPTSELRDIVRTVNADGNRLGAHANGDRAIRLLLDLLEEATAADPRPGLRHRIEHCSIVDDDILARIAALDVIVLPFGSYPHFYGGALVHWYGEDRVGRMFAHRDLLDAGVTVAGSSDYPCGPIEPLLAIQSCVTRTGFDGVPVGLRQRIGVDEALRVYTTGSAVATGEEQLKGTLTPGKLADFVVLGADPREVDPATIGSIPVRSTWVGGNQVWSEVGPAEPSSAVFRSAVR